MSRHTEISQHYVCLGFPAVRAVTEYNGVNLIWGSGQREIAEKPADQLASTPGVKSISPSGGGGVLNVLFFEM